MENGKEINELLPLETKQFPEISYEAIEKELKLTELKLRQEELEGNKQDREERKRYANDIFKFLRLFLFIILLIVVLAGVGLLSLSDTVLIALLSSTAIEVIGIFAVVVRYLFKNK
ncbi:MAG: hypothetical protein LBK96_05915 [Prevotellaceae bacterium]|jgi:hypothetical protein|nr:hypothetical protein [Prevotellaceae bacterium]